ncbi:hypothetical protein ACFLTI_05870 [Bacteroidota bacterium]
MKNIKILLVSFILTICFVSNDVNAQISELFSYDKTQLAQKMQASANLEQYVNDNPNVTFSDITNGNSDILYEINSAPITMYNDSTQLNSYFITAFAITFIPSVVVFSIYAPFYPKIAFMSGLCIGIFTGGVYLFINKNKLSKKQRKVKVFGLLSALGGWSLCYAIN